MKIEVRGLDEKGFDYAVDGIQFKTLKQEEDVDSMDSVSSSEEIHRPLELDGSLGHISINGHTVY